MIVEKEYFVELSKIGKENKLTNKALLGILEDVGGKHSNIAGFGIPTINETHLTWVLLDWKVQILRRPNYDEKILARTWSKEALKFYAFRDFEIIDRQGNIIAKATSKWALINIETGKLERVDKEVIPCYEPEPNKTVFENEEFDKIKEPENYKTQSEYTVRRADIDMNHHMHNLNYLDLANEALPEDIYNNKEFDNFRIWYKREIKLGEKVICKYSYENGKNIVAVKSEDDKLLHAVIELE